MILFSEHDLLPGPYLGESYIRVLLLWVTNYEGEVNFFILKLY